jgi:hypothetical protein
VAESKHEQIAAALKTLFEGIVDDAGATYWYAPDLVARVTFWPDEQGLDRNYQTVYLLRPGDETITEEGTSGWAGAEAEFFVIVARQHNAPTESPILEQEPTRWQVANRLIRDAVRRLLSDVTLGGLTRNVALGSLVIDRDRYLPNWAIAELRFVVSYDFVETP